MPSPDLRPVYAVICKGAVTPLSHQSSETAAHLLRSAGWKLRCCGRHSADDVFIRNSSRPAVYRSAGDIRAPGAHRRLTTHETTDLLPLLRKHHRRPFYTREQHEQYAKIAACIRGLPGDPGAQLVILHHTYALSDTLGPIPFATSFCRSLPVSFFTIGPNAELPEIQSFLRPFLSH